MTGIELSEPMVAQLRRKVGEAALPVVIGDMAATRVDGQFSLVHLVWNSIANLPTQDEQVEASAMPPAPSPPTARATSRCGACPSPKLRLVESGEGSEKAAIRWTAAFSPMRSRRVSAPW